MSDDGGARNWTPGKIFLVILASLAGLGIICCGGGYLMWGDKIRGGVAITMDTVTFMQRLQKEFGTGVALQIVPDGEGQVLIAIGVDGELTPERVVKVQDAAWKIFAESFAAHGFARVKQFAVGRSSGSPAKGSGQVSDWAKNIVSVDELVKRTGIPAPPVAAFIPKDVQPATVEVKVETTDDGAEKDKKKDEEGKSGGGGK